MRHLLAAFQSRIEPLQFHTVCAGKVLILGEGSTVKSSRLRQCCLLATETG